jgi:hypothetical protein
MITAAFNDYHSFRVDGMLGGATKTKTMDHSLFPFALMMTLILLSCAPICSAKSRDPEPAVCTSGNELVELSASLRPGDVIFISVPYYLFRKVSETTQCPANHVGIVFRDPARGWMVAESAVPLSRYTPLSKFIARSRGGWCEIRRLKGGLTEEQACALQAECDARMGILYHTGFRYESNRQFCSKFVHDAYRSALGVEVGELEPFSHLLARNPQAGLGFWRAWYFGHIPWNRITVTPASQFESPLLETAWWSSAPTREHGEKKARCL